MGCHGHSYSQAGQLQSALQLRSTLLGLGRFPFQVDLPRVALWEALQEAVLPRAELQVVPQEASQAAQKGELQAVPQEVLQEAQPVVLLAALPETEPLAGTLLLSDQELTQEVALLKSAFYQQAVAVDSGQLDRRARRGAAPAACNYQRGLFFWAVCEVA